MTIETGTNTDKRNDGERMNLSDKLAEVFVLASELIPPERQVLEEPELILAISQLDSQGKKILEIAAVLQNPKKIRDSLESQRISLVSKNHPFGEITIGGKTIPYGESIFYLLRRAKLLTLGEKITTKHLILASAQNADSATSQALQEAGLPQRIIDVNIQGIARNIKDNEEGQIDATNLSANQSITEMMNPSPLVRGTERSSFDGLIDYIVKAKSGIFAEIPVRQKLLSDLIASTNEPVSVLVGGREDVEMLICNLAHFYTTHNGVLTGNKLIVVDPEWLETSPGQAISKAVIAAENGVLFLPDIDRFLNTSLATPIRAAIESGKIRLITTMSEKQWQKAEEDRIFRRTAPIYIEKLTIQETIDILEQEKEILKKKFGLEITKEAIATAARLADRYYIGGARQLLVRAATEILMGDLRVAQDRKIDPHDVMIALEKITGIEVTLDEKEKILNLGKALRERIVGQDEAVDIVEREIRISKSGLRNPNKPRAAFLFLGPSGVGKTELAKALAEYLFGNEDALVALDMGEFQERHTVSKLIGAPPGYIGYESGGFLTEAVRRNPYTIIVFDEIEKAHPDIHNALLQLLQEGRMTDGKGRKIDFRNTIIIMTGNTGSSFYRQVDELGEEKVRELVKEVANLTFAPEFRNRFNAIVIFRRLNKEDLVKIVDIQTRKRNKWLADQQLKIELDDEVKQLISEKSYNPELGARELERTYERIISDPLSSKIVKGDFSPGETILVSLNKEKPGEIVFAKKTKEQTSK